MSFPPGPSGDPNDPMSAMAHSLDNIEGLELEDLGAPQAAPAAAAPRTENSFADARLDAPAGEGLGTGDSAKAPGAALGGGPISLEDGGAPALDLALVKGGAMLMGAGQKSPQHKGEGQAEPEEMPSLQQRGATSIAAPTQQGAVAMGHVARPRGIFAWDPITNLLAATLVGLLVAALPAYLLAASHAGSEEVEASFAQMKSLRGDLIELASPTRVKSGPQDEGAVAAALTDTAKKIDSEAAAAESQISGAHMRFWGGWLGIGLPLIVALAFLRRKG